MVSGFVWVSKGFGSRNFTVGLRVYTVGVAVGSSVGVPVGSWLWVGKAEVVGFADVVG